MIGKDGERQGTPSYQPDFIIIIIIIIIIINQESSISLTGHMYFQVWIVYT